MPDHTNDPDYQWKPATVQSIDDRVRSLLPEFTASVAELNGAYMAAMNHIEQLEAQLAEIKAKGYGGLYADELRASGHRMWIHGNADDCWCTARYMAGRRA